MRGLFAALALALAGQPLCAETLVRPDPAAIAAHVEAAIARDRVPGAAVAVIWQGEVMLLQGFGTDGAGRPVTPHTGFRLGSMSKAFTALAVMRAVEAGQRSSVRRCSRSCPISRWPIRSQQGASPCASSCPIPAACRAPPRAPRPRRRWPTMWLHSPKRNLRLNRANGTSIPARTTLSRPGCWRSRRARPSPTCYPTRSSGRSGFPTRL